MRNVSAKASPETPFWSEVRLLFQAGLLIFILTVAVGILNGLDVIGFGRNTLMTHVHAGTLGWITLGFLAACLWLFSEGQTLTGWPAWSPRWLSYGAIVSIAMYVVAFYSGNLTARLAGGVLTLLAIAGFFVWVAAQSRHVRLSVAQLGMLAAMTTLTIGAVLGVIMGIYLKGGLRSLPEGIFVTHPTTMVVGYLILAGMAISEWRLMPVQSPASADRLGMAQVALPFAGGLVLTVGALLNSFPLIALNVPLEVAGVLVYLWRLGRRVIRVPWLSGNHERLFGISVVFLVANVGLLAYLITSFVTGKYERFELIPPWLIFAMDHAMFIGVMTNGLFGLAYEVSREQRPIWSWADHVLFWGMNVGIVGFVVGLMRQSAPLKQVFTPIMGASILIAIAVYTVRLQRRPAVELDPKGLPNL